VPGYAGHTDTGHKGALSKGGYLVSKAKQYNTKSLYFPGRIKKAINGILDHPLTIIEAPMGYGKTTAVREFIRNAAVDMLWQRVYDSEIDSFWDGFARLFCELDNDRAQSLAYLRFPKDTISNQEAIKLIVTTQLFDK
jgi:LuxR family maltose regulon positive regulatory protein